MDLDSFLSLAATEAGILGKEESRLYLRIINKCVKRVPALRPSSEDVRCFYSIVYVLG